VVQLGNKTIPVPNLKIAIVNQPLGFGDSFAIVAASHLRNSYAVPVYVHTNHPIFWHPNPHTDGSLCYQPNNRAPGRVAVTAIVQSDIRQP
jgi:hypothetical protein